MPLNIDVVRLVSSFVLCGLMAFNFGLNSSLAQTTCPAYLNVGPETEAVSSSLKTEGVFQLSNDRRMFFESFNMADTSKPTLVFFPGIYSALAGDSEFFAYLESKNIPYVNFHFSSHPKSISSLNPDEELPSFEGLTSEELANEVVQLVQNLKLERPIPVTLSYS